MPISLPPPLELYVRGENSGNLDALSVCFASNATVLDEGRIYEGLAAIKEWKAGTKKKYNHTIAPLEVGRHGGKTVLTAQLSGNFPGSPVTLEFSFVLAGGKIVSLEIH